MSAVLASAEALRLELSPWQHEVRLSAVNADLADAKQTLGLEPYAEHDGKPACDYCGRSHPPAGLEDQSLGGPQVHECHDSEDCASARAAREPDWIDSQFRHWRIDWAKYNEAEAYREQLAARSTYGGGIYRLADEADPEFVLALAAVERAVEANLNAVGEAHLLRLAAARPEPEPEPRQPPAVQLHGRLCASRECDHMTMRCPDNRTHTLGGMRAHRGVTDAAAALGHRAVLAGRLAAACPYPARQPARTPPD